MKRHLLALLGLMSLLISLREAPQHHLPSDEPVLAPTTSHTNIQDAAMLAKLPLNFVENQGQWPEEVKFQTRKHGLQAWFAMDGITLQLDKRTADEQMEAVIMRLVFEGASQHAQLLGEAQQPGRFNYFLGNDPAKWKTHVPAYAQVLYRQLYVGVDLRVHEHESQLEYDVLLAPEANLQQVVIRAEGIDKLEVTAEGSLLMHTPAGPLTQKPPTTWHELPDGTQQSVQAKFVLLDTHHYSFEVPNRNPKLAMVIDPGLAYSTFLGGSADDGALATAVDLSGDIVVVGQTSSANFPITTGAYQPSHTGGNCTTFFGIPTVCREIFVTRLTASGSNIVFSTFLGGNGDEEPQGMQLAPSGAIFIAGETRSVNFPTTPGAYDRSYNGGSALYQLDGFVTLIDPTGSTLIYSTFLGGSIDDRITALAVDTAGEATIVGETSSADFPTTPGVYDRTYNASGLIDAFVTRLNSSGTALVFSTFLGGSEHDIAHAVSLAPDSSGSVPIVGGITTSFDFPTTLGAYNRTYRGGGIFGEDAFVARLSADGSALPASTYLGGGRGDDRALAIATGNQSVTVAGTTGASDFPTTPSAYDTSFNGNFDGFATQFDWNLGQLRYSTFLGGASIDIAVALVLDGSGGATIAGVTDSPDFPVTPGAYSLTLPVINGSGYRNGFVVRLNQTSSNLLYSTFLGGATPLTPPLGLWLGDNISDVSVDPYGAATVAGIASSSDFPTTPGAYSQTHNGGQPLGQDAFVTKLDMLPQGVSRYGQSTTTGIWICPGPIAMGITAMPKAGTTIELTAMNGPSSALGTLLLGSSLPAGASVVGVTLWVSPNVSIPVVTDATGFSNLAVPIPAFAVGGTVSGQFVFVQGGAICASNALTITVQ